MRVRKFDVVHRFGVLAVMVNVKVASEMRGRRSDTELSHEVRRRCRNISRTEAHKRKAAHTAIFYVGKIPEDLVVAV